jgi:Fe-S cluster biogenesis protein NfuA
MPRDAFLSATRSPVCSERQDHAGRFSPAPLRLVKLVATAVSARVEPNFRDPGGRLDMRSIYASAVTILLLLSGCSSSSDDALPARDEPSRLVTSKLEETKVIEQQAANRHIHGSYVSAAVRPQTERDSGRTETLMFLHNANFRFVGNIGFMTERAIVSARPKDPSQPVIMDDPQSFRLAVLTGRVIVSPEALTELINDHVFNFEGSPLRNVAVATTPDLLVMSGQMNRRGRWVPFSMEGPLTISGDATMAFKPERTFIEGQSASALLEAANVDLDELITLSAPGVVLTKSTVFMDAARLFPPPELSLKLKSVRIEPRGLVLDIDSPNPPRFADPLVKSDSYIVIRGGDVKFLTVMPIDILMQIETTEKGVPLDFSLYDYRAQLAAGHIKFRPDGGLMVFLQNYGELKARLATR